MSRPFSSCCPAGRLRWAWKGVKAFAWSLFGCALKLGENGRSAIVFGQSPPPGSLARGNSLEGLAHLPPHSAAQGVMSLVVLFGPQVGGLLRADFWPPVMLILKLVKGPCGRPCGMLSALPPRVTVFAGSSK